MPKDHDHPSDAPPGRQTDRRSRALQAWPRLMYHAIRRRVLESPVVLAGLTLALTVALATLAIQLTSAVTSERRMQNQVAYERSVLAQLISDAELIDLPLSAEASSQMRPLEHAAQPNLRIELMRSRSHGAVQAWMGWRTLRGYSGPIDLAIAFGEAGQVLAVDVIAHRETPGLGDRIERDRSTWLQQFSDIQTPQAAKLRADGGTIDGISGATITARAVATSVSAAAAAYVEQQRE